MLRSSFLVVLLIAALGVACNRDKAARDTNAANPPAASASDRALSAAETEFLQNAAKGNTTEVDVAKMAQDKAQDTKVKDFARQLEDDHSAALAELRRVASKANVTLDTAPPAEKASLTDRLSSETGAAFDRAYVDEMIDAHKKNIAKFEEMQAKASGDVKDFIAKMLPVMREHLQKAEELAARNK